MTHEPATRLATESTLNQRQGSLVGSWDSADSVAAQIGGSWQFDGNTEQDQITASAYEKADNTITWSAWVRLETGSPDYAGLFYDYGGINFDNAHNRGVDNEVRLAANSFWQVQTGLAVQENGWSYVALSMNGNANNETTLYVGNGGTLQSYDNNSTFAAGFASTLRICNQTCCGPTRFFVGRIDEARFASVALSADWITTEYNNQYDPTSFYTVGSEVAGGGTAVVLQISQA
ncbi:MAG: LamG-like jellyroll fold domain-containing protein [Cytophagales bacterium]|nr:LamG-like jellyroll fold domain-containing protein [Cytophagales bacterium]